MARLVRMGIAGRQLGDTDIDTVGNAVDRAVAMRFPCLAAVALALLPACATGLRLNLLRESTRRPSNISLYFTVDQRDGTPVGGLTADQFRIYEDGSPVSSLESRQTILNHTVAAVHDTLLLVDLSGSVTRSGQLQLLQAAALAFTTRVERAQRVGVYAFDGAASIAPIVPFTTSSGRASDGVVAIGAWRPRDPSTNLHGAVVQALDVLNRSLAQSPQPLKFGTLVVFTDGTDHANRVSRDVMLRAIEASPYDIFAIGVGAEIDASELQSIGRTGTVLVDQQGAVESAFDQVAAHIEASTRRFYLLSYCSPSRAGEHDVEVEALTPAGLSGSLSYRYDATGFGPGCDPNTPPVFDMSLRGHHH